jgi:K(+)-stimulated pyrophosphate-energized sodium pump
MALIKALYRIILPLFLWSAALPARAGEADIHLPGLEQVKFFHGAVTGQTILYFGLFVCAVGAAFGLLE